MRLLVQRRFATALGVAFALCTSVAAAQGTKTVSGLVVSFGIVPAELALRADGHRDLHPSNPPPGSQHLLITLDDQKTGKRIGDAEVLIEVTDPRGHVEKKALLHTQASGFPDYSDLFRFAWPGKYAIRVVIVPQRNAKPIEAQFAVNHAM